MSLNKLLTIAFASVITFLTLYFAFDIFSKLISVSHHPMEFKILLSAVAVVLIFIIQKITEKYLLNNNLGQLTPQSKILEIFDLLEDEILISNAQDLKLIYANESALKNLSYTKRQLMNKTLMTIYTQYTAEQIREYFQPLITNEKDSCVFEITRTRKDGTTYNVLVKLKYYSETNTLISVSHDITKEKALEDIKNQCISDKNHFLRNALTKISGALKIISSGMVGQVPATMQEMLNLANNNTIELLNKICAPGNEESKTDT